MSHENRTGKTDLIELLAAILGQEVADCRHFCSRCDHRSIFRSWNNCSTKHGRIRYKVFNGAMSEKAVGSVFAANDSAATTTGTLFRFSDARSAARVSIYRGQLLRSNEKKGVANNNDRCVEHAAEESKKETMK